MIYYAPYTYDLQGPADRRRFPYYAKKYNIKYELYSSKSSKGKVIANPFSRHLPRILQQAKENEIELIFETVDSLFIEPWYSHYNLLKSLKEFRINYKLLIGLLKYSSMVIVSNHLQKSYLSTIGVRNIKIIPDYSNEYKKDINSPNYIYKKRLIIGWEGMGFNAKALNEIEGYGIDNNNDIIVITDSRGFSSISNNICISAFHEWHREEHVKLIEKVDVMILPVCSGSWIHMAKPATRIRHYFNLGIPVIAYPTSANQFEMNRAGLGEFSSPISLWNSLLTLLKDPLIRRQYVSKIINYKEKYLQEDTLDSSWSDIMCYKNNMYV